MSDSSNTNTNKEEQIQEVKTDGAQDLDKKQKKEAKKDAKKQEKRKDKEEKMHAKQQAQLQQMLQRAVQQQTQKKKEDSNMHKFWDTQPVPKLGTMPLIKFIFL